MVPGQKWRSKALITGGTASFLPSMSNLCALGVELPLLRALLQKRSLTVSYGNGFLRLPCTLFWVSRKEAYKRP